MRTLHSEEDGHCGHGHSHGASDAHSHDASHNKSNDNSHKHSKECSHGVSDII